MLRRIDGNGDELFTDATVDRGYYQLTDSSFSVIAHVDANSGQVRQRMSYDSYGAMKILLPADHDGDGTVGQSDLDGFHSLNKAGDPGGDFDGNGVVNSADYVSGR